MNPVRSKLLFALTLTLAVLGAALPRPAEAAPPAAAVSAKGTAVRAETAFDGVVEAVRHTVIASQVAGAVVQLAMKAGDRVAAGQVLARIDPRSAEQAAVASEAQLRAVRATLEVARRDFERQQQLHAERFISSAALDRARAEFQASQAQVAAQAAQLEVARAHSGLHTVRAPYAGVIAEVPVAQGDMAMPGRALATIYDPAALRVSAAIPQSAAATIEATLPGTTPGARVELPALPAAQRSLPAARLQLLPAADAGTHTVTVRADLPAGLAGVAPGQFARLWLVLAASNVSSTWVPAKAIVRRAEMTGLYVMDGAGRALLRQVRLGRTSGDQVEVLAGLAADEKVATDAQAAARVASATR